MQIASCQVNYFSSEQLPPDEKGNKKMNVLIVYIREIIAASSPHSREKIHSEGLWKGRKIFRVLLLSEPALGILILSQEWLSQP